MSKPYRFCPQCGKPLDFADHGGMQRAACADNACRFVHWDNPVPVVAAIVEHEGEIILARNAMWPPKMFALITGFLEKDDPSPESGVQREVKEELNLDAQQVTFIGHYEFRRMNQLIIAYHVLATGTIQLNEELAEYKRIQLKDIAPWPGGTGLAVRDWQLKHGLTPAEWKDPRQG